MIKEALEYFARLVDEPQAQIGNRNFMKAGYTEIKPPSPEAVKLFTLASLAEFIMMAEPFRDNAFVHVVSPYQVRYVGDLTEQQTRKCLAIANPLIDGAFKTEQWMPQDKFVTDVQAFFEDKADRAKLLKVVGNVRKSDSTTLEDDGVTQKVTTAKGAVSQQMEEVPNPVVLHPWETFPEIENPERKYIVRFQGGDMNEHVTFRLFEVPDPRFSDMVCTEIKEWLRANLPSDVTVLG